MAIHKKEVDLEKRREQSRQQAEEAKKHTEEVDQLLKIEEEIRDALKQGRIDKIYNQGP